MLAWQRVLVQFSGKCHSEVGMQVNYCNGDLHKSEREAGIANQKTGNAPKNARGSGVGCILHLNLLLCSGLKVFNSFP